MKRIIKLLYIISLIFAPMAVCLVEASQIEYPSINPFLGTPENPWQEFVRFSFSLGVFLALIGLGFMWLSNKEFKTRKTGVFLLVLSSIITVLFIWIVIGFAQQTAILTYLELINANGLHFLGRYPFIFLENYSSTWSYYLYISIGFLEMIFTLSFVINKLKPTPSLS